MSQRHKSSSKARASASAKRVCPKADRKCLNPHCGRMCTYSRGLCAACYDIARVHVKEKRTTWEAMERAGKCLPAKNSNQMGPRRAWFLTGGAGA